MNGNFRLSMLTLVAALCISLGASASAMAEKRVALVIGNSKYIHASELKNPANDANAMAEQLKSLDFTVIKGTDLDETGMRAAIKQFSDAIADSKVALVFYAGHGIQVEGSNYLLPVTAELNSEIDLQFQGVSIDLLLRIMESPKRTSILLLDACRNNPLATKLARSMNQGGRTGSIISPGLARIETGVGTYIGFATSPDSIALDGDGENSPFTQALVKHIHSENEDIEAVMRNVREDVIKTTNGSQVPWGNSSLVGRGFVFKEKAEEKPAEVAAPKQEPAPAPQAQQNVQELLRDQAQTATDRQMEITFWNSIQGSNEAGYFELYLQQYPNGVFAGLARLNIAKLTRAANPPAVAEAPKAAEPAIVAETPKPVEQPKVVEAPKPVAEAEAEVAPEPVETAESAPSGYGPSSEEPKQLEVAVLTPKKEETRGLEVVVAERPQAEISVETLYEPLQGELNRLGCEVGRVDGKWGRKSQAALEQAIQRASLKVATVEPSQEILVLLREQEARICPLVCSRGFEERDGACTRIAVAQPEPVAPRPVTKRRQAAQAPRVVIQVAPQPVIRKQRACGISCVQRNIHESNRHMPPGVDSDGGQM